ncbi:MAG: 50S ribosomal protein L10 [Clostridiales bacterium]|nr:50S ribosomal protein L10 [Clostridiales bacterium]
MPSKQILEAKKTIVEQLTEKISNSKTVVLVDYRGLTVEQDTELRTALRKANVKYEVVKNTLTRFAMNNSGYSEVDAYLNGPTAIAYSYEDVVAPAKVIEEFAKKFEHLEVKIGIVEGSIFDEKKIKELSELPSREELIAKVLAGFNSPIAGFVNVLNGNLRGLVVALNAIAEKKANA